MLELLLALLTTATVGVLLVPLLRRRHQTTERLDHELALYRDQLAEIEREKSEGRLPQPEADAARTEIERRVLAASDRRVRSVACPNTARPSSGRVLPVITSIMVVLPAPFGPITQRSSPASIASDSLFSALKPSKLTEMSSR